MTEIQKNIRRVDALRNSYAASVGGYNPHDAHLARLHSEQQAEFARDIAAADASVTEILSGDSLARERAWFNTQGFKSLAQANAACAARGYSVCDLKAAAARK